MGVDPGNTRNIPRSLFSKGDPTREEKLKVNLQVLKKSDEGVAKETLQYSEDENPLYRAF